MGIESVCVLWRSLREVMRLFFAKWQTCFAIQNQTLCSWRPKKMDSSEFGVLDFLDFLHTNKWTICIVQSHPVFTSFLRLSLQANSVTGDSNMYLSLNTESGLCCKSSPPIAHGSAGDDRRQHVILQVLDKRYVATEIRQGHLWDVLVQTALSHCSSNIHFVCDCRQNADSLDVPGDEQLFVKMSVYEDGGVPSDADDSASELAQFDNDSALPLPLIRDTFAALVETRKPVHDEAIFAHCRQRS